MSSASSIVLLPSNAGKEKCVIWLGTCYFSLIPHNISDMKINVIWKSDIIRPIYVDILLEFHFVRITELIFRFTCIQTPLSNSPPIPGGYTLQFQCSFNAFDEEPKILELPSDNLMVFQEFVLDPSFREYLTLNDLYKVFEVKVVINMIEYDCTSTEANLDQEEIFRKMKDKFFNSEPVLKDLCYILHIPRVKDIFSGRQTDEFAKLKSSYISKTAVYAREIADYMKAKDACIPVPIINLGHILNYILNQDHKPISVTDLLKLYFQAHRMGLNFLIDLSRDAILSGLENQNFKILSQVNVPELNEVLQAADGVNDTILFKKVAEKICILLYSGLSKSETLTLVNISDLQGRFVVRSLERLWKKKGAVEIGESSQTSTFLCLK